MDIKLRFRYKLLISLIIGFFMGYILPHIAFYTFFTTSSKSIIVWGIVGSLLCYFLSNTRKQSILIGLVYLVALVESFLFLGQLKFSSEFWNVLLFLFIMGIVGVICGSVMGFCIYYLKKLVHKLLNKEV